MSALRSAPDQYPLLLELREVPNMEKPLDRVQRDLRQAGEFENRK